MKFFFISTGKSMTRECDLKTIKVISKKYGEHTILLDDEDFDSVASHKWSVRKHRKTLYATTNIKQSNGKWKTWQKLHRVLLKLSDPKIHVDHVDGNGLNNQRSNLRIATHQQNMMNRSLFTTNKTGFKGVFKSESAFIASIRGNKKRIYLGSFKTAEEASEAYEKKAKELFGEFYRPKELR
jgi:hypothetical protein